MRRGKVRKLFPGGNTSRGFHSFYDYITPPDVARVFVIKGGPGVGKSTFMRKIGSALVEAGYDIEEHYCSSDENSLDAVYIPRLKVALLDGTSPHVVDPEFPGAVDEIIHLGDHWDRDGLQANRSKIIAATKEISRRFRGAYRHLKAASIYNNHRESIIADAGALDIVGLNGAGEQLIKDIFRGVSQPHHSPRVRHLFASAITPAGLINHLPTLLDHLQKRYIISGAPGTGKTTLIGKVAAAAANKGFDTEVFHCAFDPSRVDHVIIPDLSIAVVNGSEPHTYQAKPNDFTLDTSRFVDEVRLRQFQSELEQTRTLYSEALNTAVTFLERAKDLHDELETYYIPNMDFAAIDRRRQQVLDEILALAARQQP